MRAIRWILLAFAILEVAALVIAARTTHAASPWTRTAGTLLLIAVIAWVAVARYQLGNAFSVTPQARKLVTTGLYARIRNPIYFASPFLVIGLALTARQWWMLLLLAVIVPMQMIRARREAAVLRAAFGDEYDRYRSQTWF